MFAGQPQYKFAINVPKRGVERGLVERTVIIHPPSDFGVEHMRQVEQGLVAAVLQVPAPDFLTDCFSRLGADRRTEIDEGLAPSVLRQPWPKRKAKKVEARFGVISSPIGIFAVDHSGLQRMLSPTAPLEPPMIGLMEPLARPQNGSRTGCSFRVFSRSSQLSIAAPLA